MSETQPAEATLGKRETPSTNPEQVDTTVEDSTAGKAVKTPTEVIDALEAKKVAQPKKKDKNFTVREADFDPLDDIIVRDGEDSSDHTSYNSETFDKDDFLAYMKKNLARGDGKAEFDNFELEKEEEAEEGEGEEKEEETEA
jgi:hypothetical protein